MGPQANRASRPIPPHRVPVHHRRTVEDLRRQPEWRVGQRRVRRCGRHVPLPGLLLDCLDAATLPVPARGHELLDPGEWPGVLAVRLECSCVCRLLHVSVGKEIADPPSRRLLFVFIMPIGLNNIGWKMYMVNASWDIVILGLIVSLSPHVDKRCSTDVRRRTIG